MDVRVTLKQEQMRVFTGEPDWRKANQLRVEYSKLVGPVDKEHVIFENATGQRRIFRLEAGSQRGSVTIQMADLTYIGKVDRQSVTLSTKAFLGLLYVLTCRSGKFLIDEIPVINYPETEVPE